MRNLTRNTIILLLFTISTLASCNDAKTPNNTNNSIAKNEQTTTTIKRVDAKTFKVAIDGKKVQLVDVRTSGEFKQGHIINAANINISDNSFMKKMAKYNKEQPVYVYCRSGARSMRAAAKLKGAGFNVVNLNGGMIGWQRSGYKSVK